MSEVLETYTMTTEEEIKWLRKCVRELQQENQQLKDVIVEVRECIKKYSCYDEETKQFCFDIKTYRLPSLLLILEKVGD